MRIYDSVEIFQMNIRFCYSSYIFVSKLHLKEKFASSPVAVAVGAVGY